MLGFGVSEQAKAGKHRMDDARALLNSVRSRGAMYMAGYSVECLLKTKLMRMFNCRHLKELEEECYVIGMYWPATHGLYASTRSLAAPHQRNRPAASE